MKNRKKLLIVVPIYPLPEDHGSAMRTMNFVRFFKENPVIPCDIDIAYFSRKTSNARSHYFDNERIIYSDSAKSSFQKKLWRLSHGQPAPIIIFNQKEIDRFNSLIDENKYDYIFFRYLNGAQLAFSIAPGIKNKIIIDVDDILSSSLYNVRIENKSFFERLIYNFNRKLLKKYENKCLSLGASLFCSTKDLNTFAGVNGKDRRFVIPNIYNNEPFKNYDFDNGHALGNVLIFVGALDYQPNIDGIKWFIENIFTAFKNKYSDARLLIVGRNPGETTIQLCKKDDHVELHGDVPDIRPFYAKARAVVVPLLAGGGTRIKILEAALARRPVLSTALGAEGIELVDKKDINLFDGINNFLSRYEQLTDKDYYYQVTQNAKNVIEKHYSQKQFNDTMIRVLSYIDTNSN